MKYILRIFLLISFSHFYAQAKYGFGAIQDLDKLRAAKISFLPSTKEILPSAYSLKKYAPIAGNQGGYGQCTAWSLAYAALTIRESVALNRTDSIENTKRAFSPSFLYELGKQNNDSLCNKGMNQISGLEKLQEIGVPRLSQFSYSCGNKIDDIALINATYNKIEAFETLPSIDVIQSIKNKISNKIPVPFYMIVTPSIDDLIGKEYWDLKQEDFDLAVDLRNNNGSSSKPRVGWLADKTITILYYDLTFFKLNFTSSF